MQKISNAFSTVAIIVMLSIAGTAQTTSKSNLDDLQKQITELESQIKSLSKAISDLRSASESNTISKTDAASTANSPPLINEPSAKKQPEPPKPKELGVDIGSARLTPYGTIFFNAFGNSGGTNNVDVPLWATPAGSGNFSASVRQTRLGIKLDHAKLGSANLGAVIEADFFGGFPAISIGENFGVVRVRLANVRLDWERTSLTIGQDWMVFAPQNPTSLAAAAIPQLAAAGNNWARLPQVKLEHRFNSHFTWQAALLTPQTGDSSATATFLLQPSSGAISRIPFIQSRIAFSSKRWFGTKKSGTIGFSGHYGRSRTFIGTANVRNDIDSIGVALDWNFPLAQRVGLAGETFFGRNLGGFQAGIFQSYNNDFVYRHGDSLIPGGVRSIGTRGGWIQLGVTPKLANDRLGLYASIGMDDPNDLDLVSASTRDWRTRNLAYAFDAIYRVTPQLSIGAEFRTFRTNYFYSGKRTASHVNLSASYAF